MLDDTEDHKQSDQNEVGYGKPPKHTRFKPGQSGNRKGRPRGSRNIAQLVDEKLGEMVTIIEGGKKVRMTRAAVVALQAVNSAMKDNSRARDFLAKTQKELYQARELNKKDGAAENHCGVLVAPAGKSPAQWIKEQEELNKTRVRPDMSDTDLK